ncbi:hypothetical protein [Herbaspirillum sp. NPDC101396]|uniref:hypothetical protein n=1 Tax=Herbaspirillum sp. NPDC101396 TaxID=3364005 RepID=UPI00383B84CF
MKNFIIAAVLLLLSDLSCAVQVSVSEDDDAVVRLAPEMRSGVLPQPVQRTRQAIAIAPLLINAAQLAQALRIVAMPDRRTLAGKGDRIVGEGSLHGVSEFRVVRPSLKLRDPLSGEHLGDEAVVLGKAVLQHEGADSVHSFIVTSSTQEIMQGDLLIPDAAPTRDSTTTRPGAAVDAQIISIVGGAAHAAQHQAVGINKGARDHIAAGMSLGLVAKNTQQQATRSPGNESGRLLIFRVYDSVSYGLITESVEALQVGDKAFAPFMEYTPH